MRTSSPQEEEEEEPTLNYTLSLAAVRSGYDVDTMRRALANGSHTYDYEVEESIHDDVELELVVDNYIEEREQPEEKEAIEEADVESIEEDKQEPDASSTVPTEIPPNKSGWETTAKPIKLKTAKKKLTRFLKKGRKKPTAEDSSKTQAVPSLTSFSVFAPSSSVATLSGTSTADEDTIGQKDTVKNDAAAEETIVTNAAIAKEESPEEETLVPLPPEQKQRDSEPKEIKDSLTTPVLDRPKTYKPVEIVKSAEEHEIPQDITSETEEDDESSFEDDHTHSQGSRFNVSKVSNRTLIVNETPSMLDESWSREEGAPRSYGFFSCMCGGNAEDDFDDFDDDDDDDDDSDSEEGRVADAVLTIQEHASRLGLSEYELLEMIQDS